MKPTIGRIVVYQLTQQDADAINRRRTNSKNIADRIKEDKWPLGAQAHIGNAVQAGEEFPMIIVRVWSENSVNGFVLLDGTDTFWATSAGPVDPNLTIPGSDYLPVTEGKWHWPEIK